MGHGCDLPCASGGVISQVAGCDLTDAGVQRDRCDLGLCAVVRSGVVCSISSALLSLHDLGFGSFFFFFANGLKVSLEMGFDRGAARSRLAGAWLR